MPKKHKRPYRTTTEYTERESVRQSPILEQESTTHLAVTPTKALVFFIIGFLVNMATTRNVVISVTVALVAALFNMFTVTVVQKDN